MKVLMFGWEFPPVISGGLGVACDGIARGLVRQGINVDFVVPYWPGAELDKGLNILTPTNKWESTKEKTQVDSSHPNEASLTVINMPSWLSPYASGETTLKTRPSDTKTGRQKSDEKNVVKKTSLETMPAITVERPQKNRILETSHHYGNTIYDEVSRYSLMGRMLGSKGDFEIIHAHDWMTFPAAIEAKVESQCPLVVHIHSTEFDRSGEDANPLTCHIEKMGMVAADRVIAVSHYTKKVIEDKYGINPGKISVVYNGIDSNSTGSKIPNLIGTPIILFLGRITYQKGPEYFVEAAKLVHTIKPEVRFVMAGAGDSLPNIIDLVAKYRLQDRFYFTGFVTGSDIARLYKMSSVYVMPSVSEPFGLTALEASSFGVPIIISKQSGVSSLLDDVLKVDFWDTKKIASGILAILEYETLGESMSTGSTSKVKKCSWQKAAKELTKVYSEEVAV